ncbi:MAG: 16S rRNA (cytosine(967)-C(5))-methyltransferase RsmB [Clostridia bacterium]|nr:16S rRNA (cytosine(967)-C(5))-methyltransferase RsmB [Clostridia bacterium]
MNKTQSARGFASSLLLSWEKEKAYADILFREAAEKSELSPRDKALGAYLFYGTVENLILIDWLISGVSKYKLKKIHPRVLAVLRVACFQILFAEKLPLHAVVNEAVNEVRAFLPQASGFSNAVLRALSRYREEEPEIAGEDAAKRLSIRYSHPEELTRLFLELFGERDAEAYLRYDNSAPPTEIRLNRLKADEESLERALAGEGVGFEKSDLPGMYTLSGQSEIASLSSFRSGLFTVQSKASALSVLLGAPRAGERVIDLCAAPGGKSFFAAELMGNEGTVVSRDLYPGRTALIREGAERLGITSIRAEVRDAAEEDAENREKADLVIADVPCSGLGVIARKPDVRYKSMEKISSLPVLQLAILERAGELVRPGGRIVYSTCTVNPEENEKVVDRFLSGKPGFEREDGPLPAPYATRNGERTLLPFRDGTDGFYYCRIARKETGRSDGK